MHGYDNAEESMHAIFMAKGPQFISGKTIQSLQSVDLYDLFCEILNIECKPNDGTLNKELFNEILRDPKSQRPSRMQRIINLIKDKFGQYLGSRK